MDKPKYQHCSYKNKHKCKLRSHTIPSNRFTIMMNSCSPNPVINPDLKTDADPYYDRDLVHNKRVNCDNYEHYENEYYEPDDNHETEVKAKRHQSHKSRKNHKDHKSHKNHKLQPEDYGGDHEYYPKHESPGSHDYQDYYEGREDHRDYQAYQNYEPHGYYKDHDSYEERKNYSREDHDRYSGGSRPAPEICGNDPVKHHHCIPRRGELIINGSFENRPDPFNGWVINSGVKEIDLSREDIAHQGLNAATLGCPNPYAHLYQDVPGICPDSFYQLNFFLSAASKHGSARVYVRLEFLDHHKNLLDCPALEFMIPEDSLSNEVYAFFNNATRVASPPEARFARIHFKLSTHEHPERYVHLDDVSLIAI